MITDPHIDGGRLIGVSLVRFTYLVIRVDRYVLIDAVLLPGKYNN